MVNLPRAAGEAAGGTAGSFIGGLANNPAIVIIALILGGLFIFRSNISEAFGSLGENFGKIEFPDITLPEINLPSLDFDISLGDPLGAAGAALGGAGEAAGGFFEGLTEQFDSFIKGLTPSVPLTEADQFDFSDLEGGVSPMPTGEPAPPFSDAAIFAKDFPEEFIPIQTTPESVTVAPSLLDDVMAPFTGGGVSFEGGTIFETPLENLSLNQIIEKLGVTASQAANLQGIAEGFTPEQEAFLTQGQEISPLGDVSSMPAVSEGFEGLTPEEIFSQLVGGNISNF